MITVTYSSDGIQVKADEISKYNKIFSPIQTSLEK